MALLLITHDLGIVRQHRRPRLVMTKGEIVEQGPVAEVFAAPQHPYTQHAAGGRAQAAGPPPPIPTRR